jgi:hypothetical protein
MRALDIVGITEISELTNVGTKSVRNWYVRGIMPPPDAKLACGPIWRRSTITRWMAGAGKERVALLQKLGEAA